MTYSTDYRKQVLSSIADGMTIREAALFYGLSTSTIHSWQQKLASKATRNKAPTKIPDDALFEDVKRYPDDYNYERARRLNCSKTGIFNALKRLGISQKKDLGTSKSLHDKKSGVSE
ncbi:IS630 transposase-related protein [Psychrobacter sp. DAB_AL32B]|uniref:IS630 transposase-related protein n=1 Tax=Psychrobacter sp. DAB_AL32B TaxID=1028414 RepID=UPI000B7DCC81|nr:IS630 transposase-related protein [Psychrobacter sp. DAB_AL32B]OXL27532.1 transposase [Psychrobacter sp. DAB_AL32B]